MVSFLSSRASDTNTSWLEYQTPDATSVSTDSIISDSLKENGRTDKGSMSLYQSPPSSIDTDTDSEWTLKEVEKLRQLSTSNLTRVVLQQAFPTKSIKCIHEKIKEVFKRHAIDWTKGEVYLLGYSLAENSSINMSQLREALPLKKQEEIKRKIEYMLPKVSKINKLCKEMIPSEIATLLSTHFEELSEEYLASTIRSTSLKEVTEMIHSLFANIPWSKIDDLKLTELINKGYPITEFKVQFPFRSERSIKQRILKLKEYNNSISTKSENEKERERLLKELKDVIDYNSLHYCIKNDLTKSGLQEMLPNITIKKLVYKIKCLFDLENLELTAGEKNHLKTSIKNGESIDSIAEGLPLRDRKFIESKCKEIEFAGTRRTKFRNAQEKLIYEAKWTLMENSGSRSSNSRRRACEIDIEETEKEAARIKIEPKPKRKLSEEEILERKQKAELRNEEKKRIREKKRLEMERRKKERLALGIQSKVKHSNRSLTEQLKEAAEYFQTVVGDRRPIEEGEKRRRIPAIHYSPEPDFKKTKSYIAKAKDKGQIEKQVDKRTVKTDIRMKRKEDTNIGAKGKRKKTEMKQEKQVPAINTLSGFNDDKIIDKVEHKESDNKDNFSPFDPIDIKYDSLIPLHGRRLYVSEFYNQNPVIPELHFVNDQESIVMTKENDEIALNDTIAAEIICAHEKSYRDLPTSFPPFTSIDSNTGRSIINTLNRINVRFLLYPQHYESFILAAPKSNELNPIYEIQKLFQIHYALYFSHSSKIKKIIMEEYCEKLEDAIEENSFSDFMFVIDKWNKLMVYLSPNKVEFELTDINEAVRVYLIGDECKEPTLEDLRLDIFFQENSRTDKEDPLSLNDTIEPPSPLFDIVEVANSSFFPSTLTPPLSSSEDDKENVSPPSSQVPKFNYKLDEPMNVRVISETSAPHFTRPENYISDFFRHLNEKTDISRFCIQQIFLRVYSRIVSTDSRKLRSYKAFTAEVYGELLPSFTSEVLSKVNLLPHQKFYDLGSGVGNTTFQAALEFGAVTSGGCELMEHASKLTQLQLNLLQKNLAIFGLKKLNLNFALSQSFVDNDLVRKDVLECDVLIVNNYLFDVILNSAVGRLLYGLKPGTKIISLRNFIRPRYKATGDETIFDRLRVEKHEMSEFLSVSWTANKVPYYISTVQDRICPEYL